MVYYHLFGLRTVIRSFWKFHYSHLLVPFWNPSFIESQFLLFILKLSRILGRTRLAQILFEVLRRFVLGWFIAAYNYFHRSVALVSFCLAWPQRRLVPCHGRNLHISFNVCHLNGDHRRFASAGKKICVCFTLYLKLVSLFFVLWFNVSFKRVLCLRLHLYHWSIIW